ncbi:MAG: sodium pump decarboxylase subunit gamma [Clostridia bacterium]|nr:sodium pump decarboxylase subunit gamma [Clostridia bacterium]
MNPLLYGLLVTLFGIVIVFLVLVALWGILAMMKSFFGEKGNKTANQNVIKNEPAPAAVAVAKAEPQDAEDDELIAVIMAAISASLGSQSNLVIKKITRVGDSTPIWGQIGRHEQMLNRL